MNKSDIPTPQKGVLSMLLDDHRTVKKIFNEFKTEKNASKKQALIKEACKELIIHTQIEEQKFYPFLREQDPKVFGDLLDEALVEHASAKELIRQLDQSGPHGELHDAKFTVLGEYVNHHVLEEENELFPKVISKKVDLQDLQPQIVQLKEELMTKMSSAKTG